MTFIYKNNLTWNLFLGTIQFEMVMTIMIEYIQLT